ncbi:MAG: GNAT family N-acetyltransferase [Tannerella sp.]|jgi:GNAT superfamily N-acetyltransferase|nr:GNAT family N-acetyltransferase [Tannerella sp.]
MEIIIRRATLQNIDVLMKWRMEVLHEVFSLSPETDTGMLEKSNRLYYEQSLPCDHHIACFACDGEEIVGCGGICIYQEMPSPDNPTGWCGYLMNIYTTRFYRNRGIGKKTVQWLVEQARQRGITKVYLETSDSARGMYLGMGFEAMPDLMRLTENC